MAHQTNKTWFVYDCATNPTRPGRALTHLKKAFCGYDPGKGFWLPSQQQSADSNDCGPLTAANTYQLVQGRKPCAYKYNTKALRE